MALQNPIREPRRLIKSLSQGNSHAEIICTEIYRANAGGDLAALLYLALSDVRGQKLVALYAYFSNVYESLKQHGCSHTPATGLIEQKTCCRCSLAACGCAG